MINYDILKKDGLTIELLTSLSFKSKLNPSLKRTLRHFDKQAIFKELQEVNEWYDLNENLHDILIDYRIKSLQSAYQKYHRYPLNRPLAKVFNDLLGFRTLCDNYEDILSLSQDSNIYIVDMSKGKSNDDGYRGVHIYFQLSNYHYPIEVQYNTYYDRQLNNWLHKYVYKKNFPNSIGITLREKYEQGCIQNETIFKEVLSHVLSNS